MALVRLKKGDDVARIDWLAGVHNELSKDGTKIFHMLSESEDEEYLASSEDMLANDWVVVKEAD